MDKFINQIIHGDSLEVMKNMPDKSIDCVITDPPYGTTGLEWDNTEYLEGFWSEVKRIIKKQGAIVMTASQPFTTLLISSNLSDFKYCWVWNKKISGNPLLAKYQPLKVHEDICVFSDGTHKYYPVMRKGLMRIKGGGRSKLLDMSMSKKTTNDDYYPLSIIEISNAVRGTHPTEKPVSLMRYLVLTYTTKDDIVLDPFLGSGATAVACKELGRNYIGIEINPDYIKIANDRLAQDVLFS